MHLELEKLRQASYDREKQGAAELPKPDDAARVKERELFNMLLKGPKLPAVLEPDTE